MPITNPQASLKIRAQILPAAATEPNIGKELEMTVDRVFDLSGMTAAYCVEITALTLDGLTSVASLDLSSGIVTNSVGTHTLTRSGKDAFGNSIASPQTEIGLILIEADAANAERIGINNSESLGSIGSGSLLPGKFIAANGELPGDLSLAFEEIGDSAKITVFSAL